MPLQVHKISSIDSMINDSFGLLSIAGELTFDTQMDQGMALAINSEFEWATLKNIKRCPISEKYIRQKSALN